MSNRVCIIAEKNGVVSIILGILQDLQRGISMRHFED